MSLQRDIVTRMIGDLPRRFPACGILLAGSVQRGEERPDSDLDLFVVFPGDGDVRLEHETSREGIKVDLAVFPEDGFRREVKRTWFKFWMFSQAEIVHDPTGIAKRNRQLARSYFERHPAVDRAWVEQMAEVRRHKADRSYLPEYPTWDGFAEHIEKIVAESAPGEKNE